MVMVFIDCQGRYKFFSRLSAAMSSLNISFSFITNKLSIYLRGRREGKKIFLTKSSRMQEYVEVDLGECYDVRAGLLSSSKSASLYTTVYHLACAIHRSCEVDYCFLWGGDRTPEIALKDFCVNFEIPVLHFEIANIPGKIFVDKKGVNARSNLYENPDLLEQFTVSPDDFEVWKKEYLDKKYNAHLVPQAKIGKPTNWSYLVDWFGYNLLGVPESKTMYLVDEVRLKLTQPRKPPRYDSVKSPRNYVFFPMQVSTDTQLVINSRVDNFEAIRYSSELATMLGCELFVKPHPAEPYGEVVDSISALRDELGFYLVDENTFLLLQNASHVVTINSTVGLEAKILGKEVTFLGDSYFQKLSYEKLGPLILGYFLDIDYFDESPIKLSQVEKIMSRINSISDR